MEQENKKINKKMIIIGVLAIVIIAIIVGIVVLSKRDTSSTNGNNPTTQETSNMDEYTALEEDIEKAISEKNLIKASGYYAVLKFSVDNGGKVDNERYTKITNDLQALKDERKAELLTKVDITYDDMTQLTEYTVKGSEPIYDDVLYFVPVLKYDGTNELVVFGTQFGVIQEDWIFFDSLIINVDGNITNISRANFDKYTEVLDGGYVWEYAVLYLQKYPMFNALVEEMINGNEIKIRFVGQPEKGNTDCIINTSARESLAILYELSLCL